MNSDGFQKLLFDEIKELRKDVADIKNEMNTLKVKVALFSSVIGSLITFLANKLF